MKRKNSLILFSLVVLLSSCKHSTDPAGIEEEKLREPLIQFNKTAAEIESEQIEAFLQRRQWNTEKSGTGLRYYIYKKGNGPQAVNGQVARVNFEISLINGTICYSTKDSGPREFKIGGSEVESGLHEGITYLQVGDKAKLILPSHLAYGLIGDQEKIPPRATIIYDIELLELK